MKWLVTLEADIDAAQLQELLRPLDSTLLADTPMIPMGKEFVIEVEGPDNLANRIGVVSGIKAVHPSSEITLY